MVRCRLCLNLGPSHVCSHYRVTIKASNVDRDLPCNGYAAKYVYAEAKNMRRVWFKKEMRQGILKGKKTSTTRDHALPLGQVLAVSGSRFKAESFAILKIQDRIPTTVENVIRLFYKEEGFSSPEEMTAYAKKNKLLQTENNVFYHKFKIIKEVKKP